MATVAGTGGLINPSATLSGEGWPLTEFWGESGYYMIFAHNGSNYIRWNGSLEQIEFVLAGTSVLTIGVNKPVGGQFFTTGGIRTNAQFYERPDYLGTTLSAAVVYNSIYGSFDIGVGLSHILQMQVHPSGATVVGSIRETGGAEYADGDLPYSIFEGLVHLDSNGLLTCSQVYEVWTTYGSLICPATTLSGTGSITPVVVGTGSLDCPTTTLSGTGEREIPGTGSLDCPNTTLSGAGEISRAGTGALTNPAVTLAGTGAIIKTGNGGLTNPAVTLSGAGIRTSKGAGALTTTTITLSGAGVRDVTGAGAIDCPNTTMSGAGVRDVAGTGALTTTTVTLTGAGAHIFTGTGALDAPTTTLSGTGERVITGSGALDAPTTTLSGTGVRAVTGAGAIINPGVTSSGAGIKTSIGTGALDLPVTIVRGRGALDAATDYGYYRVVRIERVPTKQTKKVFLERIRGPLNR